MQNPLTLPQKQVVQDVMAKIEPASGTIGLLFYARLFELDPGLRGLFKTDLADQGHAVVTMLRLCVEGMDERVELRQALEHLGKRHVEYGVKPRDYVTVRAALLWALAQGLGAECEPETEAALGAMLDWFIALMQGRASHE
jgi:hemoglobin-like flavoprotein